MGPLFHSQELNGNNTYPLANHSQVVPKHKEFAPFDVKNLVKNMTANKLLFVGVLIQ